MTKKEKKRKNYCDPQILVKCTSNSQLLVYFIIKKPINNRARNYRKFHEQMGYL